MISRHSTLAWLALCAGAASACSPHSWATTFQPQDLQSNEGALFGHVEVLNEGKPINKHCLISFAEDGETRLRLDETGWVFTKVPLGPTRLYSITCGSHRELHTDRLAFQVAGNGRITYFGHIRIDMQYRGPSRGQMLGRALAGAIVGAALSGMVTGGQVSPNAVAVGAIVGVNSSNLPVSEEPRRTTKPIDSPDPFAAVVDVRFEDAVAEYRRRFAESGIMLRPIASIAGSAGDTVGVLASTPPPESAMGFSLGQELADAESRCTSAGMTWQKLDDGGFTCSSPTVVLGVPAALKLTTCAGKICEIIADASADAAPWSTLVERFDKLTERLEQQHGSTHERKRRALAGCTSSPRVCTAAGQMLMSETWRWPEGQQVRLVLHGGAPGGTPTTPTLLILYRIGEGGAEKQQSFRDRRDRETTSP